MRHLETPIIRTGPLADETLKIVMRGADKEDKVAA
jgi:hypothetical protein